MPPEIAKGLTDIFQAASSAAVMLIGTAAAYVAWKLRQLQQDRERSAEDQRDKSAVAFLNDLVSASVAYTSQTMGLDKAARPLSEKLKKNAEQSSVVAVYDHIPPALMDRLLNIYAGAPGLAAYVRFRIEGEVTKQACAASSG